MNAPQERSREGGMRAPLWNHGHNPVTVTNRYGRRGPIGPHNATGATADKTGREGFAASSNITATPMAEQSFFPPRPQSVILASSENRYHFARLDARGTNKFREVN